VFTLDDRTGNVVTTVALFAVVAGVVFAARATLVVFLLALLLAYLLEPLVAWVQRLLPVQSHSRTGAIAVVYLTGSLLMVGAGYALAPALAGQMQQLYAIAPEMLARFTNQGFLEQHNSLIAATAQRTAGAVAAAAAEAGWLLMVPIIAIFFLQNRPALVNGTVDFLARRRERASVKRTIENIDTMLAQYTRAQLTLAGLSSVVYTGSMALLRIPYPLGLGLLGGALEFIPAFGWILAAAAIITSGWLAHAHWLWMAGVIVVWRVVQNFVVSPRVMGDRMQMEPMTVIFALMAGGQIGGLLGVLLSVPVLAVLRIVWLERSSRQNAQVTLVTSASAPMSNS
jgi:predicted PurR-regulated permease PerM